MTDRLQIKLLTVTALAILYSGQAFGSDFENDLIAHYRLGTNGIDSLGKSPPFVTTNESKITSYTVLLHPNARFTNGVLYVNGRYEPNGTQINYLSTGPIKELSYQSFTLALDFYPLPQKRKLSAFEANLNIWTRGFYGRLFPNAGFENTANILTGGSWFRWIGCNREDDQLTITLNNQAFVHQFKGVRVLPGRWHNLICSVDLRQGKILTLFDGQHLETITLPSDFKLAVVESTNKISDAEFVFQNYSNGSVFFGYAANLRVLRRALAEAELGRLQAELAAERPRFPANRTSSRTVPALVVLAALVSSVWWVRRRARRRPGGVIKSR